jgi:magnesium chelatase subunit I
MGVIPAITGKIELVYEGEQEGADNVAQILIEDGVKTLFNQYFPEIKKLERKDADTPYDSLIHWFFESEGIELLDDLTDEEYRKILSQPKPLNDLVKKHLPDLEEASVPFAKEIVLWGLEGFEKLSKSRFTEGFRFRDLYGSYIRGL